MKIKIPLRPILAAVIGLTILLQISPGEVWAASRFPPPAGLTDWWPGDGSAADIIGTNNCALDGGATASGAGLVGPAFSFDGTNGFVAIPDSPAFHPTVFTIEAWVNFKSLNSAVSGAPAGQQYIVFKQNSRSGSFEGINLSKGRGAGGDFFIFGVTSSAGVAAEVDSPAMIVAGTWYHVAGVRTANSIQLYVNGQLLGQASVSFPQDYGVLPLYFGTSGQTYWDGKLNGLLDEVSLYNVPLSSNQIASIYTAGAAGKCKAISIATQPQSLTVPPGANVSFTAGVSGTLPIVYQWQRAGTNLIDGGNIFGSASNIVTLTNVQVADSAGYQLIATNNSGSATSMVATLTVNPNFTPPSITNQPASQSVSSGTNVIFTVGAMGGTPLGYQWLLNGQSLTEGGQFSGTATPALTVIFALPANAGGYSVIVTNSIGSVTSVVATLSVSAPTGCLPAPSGLVGWWPGDFGGHDVIGTNNGILQGGAVAGTPGVVGGAFHMDGTNGYVQINNAPELNQSVLTVECWVRFDELDTPGTSTLGAQYIVFKQNTRMGTFEGINLSKHRYGNDIIVWEASSASGQATELRSLTTITSNVWYHLAGVRGSNYMELYVNGRLEVHTNINYPQDYGVLPLYFGTSNEPYWDHKLSGSLDEVSLYNRPLTSNEIYALYLAGSAGKCKEPVITVQPSGGSPYWGGSITLNSGASGVNPLALQWSKNGAPIAGATNVSLTLTNIQLSDAGSYTLTASNAYGFAASSPAVVAVNVVQVSIASTTTGGSPGQFGLNISGMTNQTYGIQYSPDLGQSNNWVGLTNITLTSPTNVWFDPQAPTRPKRYYRVVPGPISVP